MSIPNEVLGEIKRCHVTLKGPTHTPEKGDSWPNLESANVSMRKALDLGLLPLVIINKVDRQDVRIDEVVDDVYQLFFDLDAAKEHIEFPIISAIARQGRSVAGLTIPDETADLGPLLDAIVESIPAPAGDPQAPLQALVTNLDASDYLGRLAIGRVVQGTLRIGEQVALCHSNPEEPPL